MLQSALYVCTQSVYACSTIVCVCLVCSCHASQNVSLVHDPAEVFKLLGLEIFIHMFISYNGA